MKPVKLIEHPEGGRYREVFRSEVTVTTCTGQSRSAMTHIYFSLDRGEVSRFHRVLADEIWNLYAGDGLRMYTWDGTEARPTCTELSVRANRFCCAVQAGSWQAAEPMGESVLVGCSVGPGFEFDDFELIEPNSAEAKCIRSFDPTLTRFIDR